MKVLVYGRAIKEEDTSVVKELFTLLKAVSFEVFMYADFQKTLDTYNLGQEFSSISDTVDLKDKEIDLLISLGGDGTILKATTLIDRHGIPILGINLGRLGFLANAEKNKLKKTIDDLVAKNYTIEERNMIHLSSNEDLFGNRDFALNDFTIHKRDNSSMILIHCYINDELLNSYWADGIIVSTPTGSTGYSLSCGGPIISPGCGNFVISPVAPHNLNARPIVVKDDARIKFKVEGRSEYFLCTLDSRYEKITSEHVLELSKCPFTTKLIQFNDSSFLKTIHKKLMWGSDKRNL